MAKKKATKKTNASKDKSQRACSPASLDDAGHKPAGHKPATGDVLFDKSFRAACHTLGFSPDSGLFVASAWGGQKVSVWDLNTNKWLWRGKEHTGPCYSAVFSPDGNCIASCGPAKDGRREAGAEILSGAWPRAMSSGD